MTGMKINQTELAAYAENAPRAEVTKQGSDTVVYSGTPADPDPANADRCQWTVCRTVVSKANGATTVETTWARGPWADRASLDYMYSL